MTEHGTTPRSLEELLAHALAMENEAAERYGELADQMTVHHNGEVAEFFGRMAGLERQHAGEIAARAEGLGLPRIAPWDYRWPSAESPEAVAIEDVRYLMSPQRALRIAIEHEQRAAAFYKDVAALALRADVRELAARLAQEEQGHTHLLEQWLARFPPETERPEDPDPPNTPE